MINHLLMRAIPATMATQHPDNARAPYWGSSPFISTLDEVEECFRVFSDLDCDEYMWDWEGKFVDEAVVDRLFNKYAGYFLKRQLGRDKFLTFRIPNIWEETGFRLARSFMTIITAAHTAREHGVHSPPLFEVILPMTTHASQLLAVQKKYIEALKFERSIFEEQVPRLGQMEIIPLIEGSVTLIASRQILKEYVKGYERLTRRPVRHLRPFIARSDPALDAGLLPAILSARGALSEYYRFEEESGIRVFPIIGVGCLPFRGGLTPDRLDPFLKNYAGVRTVTLQSSFRYDYPRAEVKRAIRTLRRRLPRLRPRIFSSSEIVEIARLSEHFASFYRPVVTSLAQTINEVAKFIPAHRERIPHTGHFGYSRKVGKKTSLPRAIAFVATFASLGIPPSLIGTGRGLKALLQRRRQSEGALTKFLPTLEADITKSGAWLNWENLKFLSKTAPGWKAILEDVRFLEAFLGRRLEPKGPEHFIHRNLTSNIYHYWKSGRKEVREALQGEILRAAIVRRSLG